MQRFKKFIEKHTSVRREYNQKFHSLGIPFNDYCEYHYKHISYGKQGWSELFGIKIKRINAYSYVHTVEGIFVEELYKFASVSERPFILDCGANIGLSSIYFKRLFPQARVVAFEPDKAIFEACRYNLNAFGFTDVELVNAAVWTFDGDLRFLPDHGLGGMVVDERVHGHVSKVPAVALKKYLSAEIDLLKLDIEGAEWEVLTDCKDDLGSVKNLFVEYHSPVGKPQRLHQLLTILNESGFRCYVKPAWDYLEHPFADHAKQTALTFDLQLNIFAYRQS